jgi:probable addiction module antidote protein
MTLELIPFDAADHFRTDDAQAELLRDALREGDARYIKHALNIVARARGMTQMEKDTGIRRQALYRALGEDGNPTLDTLISIIKALRVKLTVVRDEFFVRRAMDGGYAVGRRTIRNPAPMHIHGETMLYGAFPDRASAYRWVAALEASQSPRPSRRVARQREEAVQEMATA